MRYKAGDKVRVRKDLTIGKVYAMNDGKTKDDVVEEMMNFAGKTVTIERAYEKYRIEGCAYNFVDEMLEPVNTQKIVITSDGTETLARLYDGNKVKMTDKKFTDEEIIKALECCEHIQCQGENCPYHPLNRCIEQLRHDCYDLINRQKAEIEELKAKRYMRYELHSVIDLAAVLDNNRADAIYDTITAILRQAIQEYLLDGIENYYCLTFNQIEQIAKELTEGNNGSNTSKQDG